MTYDTVNPNEASFPNSGVKGLTKREYFAAMALQGFCAGGSLHFNPEMYSEYSIKYADALIAELNKTESNGK